MFVKQERLLESSLVNNIHGCKYLAEHLPKSQSVEAEAVLNLSRDVPKSYQSQEILMIADGPCILVVVTLFRGGE